MWLKATASGSWHVVEGPGGAMERALCGVRLPDELAPNVAFVDSRGMVGEGGLGGRKVCQRCVKHLRATLEAVTQGRAA